VWGWNKYNTLFADSSDVKTKKIYNPFNIKIDPSKFGKVEEDDYNDYALEFNMNGSSDVFHYHTKRSKLDKLPEHEKKIDLLHTENFSLKNEMKV
jgi:hypothetical protein